MRALNLGAQRAPGGFYLLNRRERGEPTPFVDASGGDGAYRHRFSYQRSETSIADAAVEIVRGARRKIFLASYRIGDGPLLEALYEAVDRLHGGVYVITSWDSRSLRRGAAELAGEEEVTEDEIKAQNKRFDDMTRRGIVVRGHPGCHAKFLLADDRIALVSSANLERSALRDSPARGATGESGAVITDAGEVERLARFFTRLWFTGCTSEAAPGEHYVLRDIQPETTSPCPVDVPEVTDRPGVIWTHDTEQVIRHTISDVVGRSQNELLLASYSLVGMAERTEVLLEAVATARRRGVRVSLLVRGRNLPGDLRDAGELAALGVHLCPDSLTHAKGVIADDRHGALFSANFDTHHGLFNGVEVGVRLDHTPALGEAARYLRHAMAHADMRFVLRPTQDELNTAYPARWRRPWPHGPTIRVAVSDRDWTAFLRATASPPVLYEESADSSQVILHTGQGRWCLRRSDGAWKLTPMPPEEPDPPGGVLALMSSWSQRRAHRTGGSSTATPRGFLAATVVRI